MEKGFTLIELIVVIAIIAILAAIIAPNAFKAIEKAKIAKVISDMEAMGNAALAYYTDIGFFPPDIPASVDPGLMKTLPYNISDGTSVEPSAVTIVITHPTNWKDAVNARWDGPYLEKYPSSNPWGGNYDYDYWPDSTAFTHPLSGSLFIGLRGLPTGVLETLNQKDHFVPLPAGYIDSTEYSIAIVN